MNSMKCKVLKESVDKLLDKIRQHTYLKNILSAIISVVFSYFLLLLGRPLIAEVFGVKENFYLEYYYNYDNGKKAGLESFSKPKNLYIINTQKYRSRKDIAKILGKVYNLNPSVIGLDIFFEDNTDIADSVNRLLVDTLHKVKDKTVLPCFYYTDRNGKVATEYPFFKNEKGLEDIIYASPVSQGFYEHYKFNDSDIINKNKDFGTLYRFSYEVARRSGVAIRDTTEAFYVNYSRKDFVGTIINDTASIDSRNIEKNSIILIGDISDIKDMERMPFRFGNKDEISGVEDHAYSIISLINDEVYAMDSPSKLNAFHDLHFTGSFLIALCLSFLCSNRLRKYEERKTSTFLSKSQKALVVTLLPIQIIFFEIIVIAICFLTTRFFFVIPDLFVSIISIVLVKTSNEITDII